MTMYPIPPEPSGNPTSSAPATAGVTRRGFLRSLGTSAAIIATLGASGVAKAVPEPRPEFDPELGPTAAPVTLMVNGKSVTLQLEPRVTLLEALRVHAGLTGAKESCDRASCGACTVLINGEPVYACSMLAIEAQGVEITTVEGVIAEGKLSKVQQALIDHDGLQCGYCSPGVVLTLTALLRKNPHPPDAEVRRACAGNLCRCGAYPRIFAAALGASGKSGGLSKLKVISPHSHALA